VRRLADTYPFLFHVFPGGSATGGHASAEGTQLQVLRMSTTPTRNDPSKPELVLLGCHHAREWISEWRYHETLGNLDDKETGGGGADL
jgi:hypothetical protein